MSAPTTSVNPDGLKQCKKNARSLNDGRPASKPKIVAIYDYCDEKGNLLFQVVRFDPKDFRQRRPNGKGGFTWGLGDTRRVLYRLPELVKAHPEETIFLAEGERDVDNLVKLGCVATTSPMGAGNWRSEYNGYFRDRQVVILPDNDEAGRKYAQQVAEGIYGAGADVTILELPDLPKKGDISDWIDAGGDKDKLIQLAKAAPAFRPVLRFEKPSSGSSGSDDEEYPNPFRVVDDDRPIITITTEEHIVNDQAISALLGDDSIYQRGCILVRVVSDTSPASKGIRRPFAPRIDPLPPPLLRERLAANARWLSIHHTKDGEVERPSRPPAWCVAAVHARGSWKDIPHLEAVIDYPILRPDGSLLSQPGYDPDTGLLLEIRGTIPNVPDHPTKDDVNAARDLLLDVVADFPFEREAHRAAWLAALLTPLARFAFDGPAPLFLVDANVRAAGKGLLLNCISRIITGNEFTIATYSADEDELRKRITSLAIGGDRLVLFDNVEGKFGNATLDAALTGTSWKDRLLGVNRMAEAPLYMTWFATGNNVSVGADTARRICHIRLESPNERPEERNDFRRPNLLAWISENRPHLLAAALTILRGYCAAGKPNMNLPTWGSFEKWSALVRSAIVWTELPDPGETRLLLQEQADTTATSMGIVLECWEKLDPARKGLTAAEVIQRLYKSPPDPMPDFYADMKDALEGLLGKPDSRNLGTRLRSYRRRIFNGLFIDHAGTVKHAIRWAVFPAEAFRAKAKYTHHAHHTHQQFGECGERGECNSAQAASQKQTALEAVERIECQSKTDPFSSVEAF